jgi:hypothetical protein
VAQPHHTFEISAQKRTIRDFQRKMKTMRMTTLASVADAYTLREHDHASERPVAVWRRAGRISATGWTVDERATEFAGGKALQKRAWAMGLTGRARLYRCALRG